MSSSGQPDSTSATLRPIPAPAAEFSGAGISPLRLTVGTLLAVFSAEFALETVVLPLISLPPFSHSLLTALALAAAMVPVAYLYIYRPLTAKAKALDEWRAGLIESEERFRTLFENAPDALMIADTATGRITGANRAAAALAGRRVEQLAGLSVLDIVPPETRDEHRRRFAQHAAQGGGGPVEFDLLRSDGSRAPVELKVTTVRIQGRDALMGEFRDISARRVAETERARLVTAISQVADMIMITSPGGVIQFGNPAFEQITGYSAAAVVGLTPRLVKSGRQPDEFYRDMWRMITARQVWRGQLVNRRKDGTLYEEAMTISPVLDERGDIVHFVAVKRDVSGERALARAREYFAAVTSHELRTPLTKLKLARASLDEACGGCCAGPALDSLSTALLSASASLERVVNTSELFTDLMLKRADQPRTTVDLAAVMLDCVESARSHALREGRRVDISLAFAAPGEPLPVLCHQAMIHDALFELVSNAVKYTPDGAAAAVWAGREGDEAAVRVCDQGIGIPRESLLKVFEPFYSLEDTRRHSSSQFQFMGGGLGMGLTLARLVAEHHGGRLTVESEGEGAGAVILLRLPLTDVG